MSRKSLINQLELAYAPLTAYEFAVMKSDKLLDKALKEASLYIIGQRPVMSFENVIVDKVKYQLNFEIHQEGNKNKLKVNLPLIQTVVGSKNDDTIVISFNYFQDTKKAEFIPFVKIHGFSLLKNQGNKNKFLIWFSPEKLLQNWWKGNIDCSVKGNYQSFTMYKVHYVGKATKQSILKRLTGHPTLQDILSLESPVTDKQLPANEIVILPFKFQENIQIQSFGPDSDIETMVAAFNGCNYPNQEKIFLDAEKALIKAIKPEYNKAMFNNYPVSKDGLYDESYNAISYSFIDPITLIYKEGEISGKISPIGGDAILILENKEMKLVKNK
jgi:hypothetical protein